MIMPLKEYNKARKSAMKDFRAHSIRGEYPYLQVLDDILNYTETDGECDLGLVEIPIAQIAGTKSRGRTNAFASNFMPLLEEDTEFAAKWINLSKAHFEEGIRDPVEAYEFMNHFYIVEGNKRVSVMKHFGAVTIPGHVTRIIPKKNTSKESIVYYEFMDFYRITHLNFIIFSEPGSYSTLLKYINPDNHQRWNTDMQNHFKSAYYRFTQLLSEYSNMKLPLTPADAFLIYLDYHRYEDLFEKSQKILKEEISLLWEDFLLFPNKRRLTLKMDPEHVGASPLRGLLRRTNPPLKVAFIYSKSPETSKWTYMHDLGRRQLEEEYGNQISILVYDNIQTAAEGTKAMEEAIKKGCSVLFVTTPSLLKSCTSIAGKYPHVKILNCSLNTCYGHMKTYYGRLYEAKFVMGAIAGIMAQSEDIGYLADYPIYGAIANINAFALGVGMVNPDAHIHLYWYTQKDLNIEQKLREANVSIVSGYDNLIPNSPLRFGLYDHKHPDEPPLAMPVWNWGSFYIQIIDSILNYSWKKEPLRAEEAINYWWGMSSGLIDVLLSGRLPAGVRQLADVLKTSIQNGMFHPFSGTISDQNGKLKNQEGNTLTPNEIMTMDWLTENIIGTIPDASKLVDDAKTVMEIQGIYH